MRRRILVIGSGGSGKTFICNYINGENKMLLKTQDVIFGRYTVDVPGSYLDSPWMYKHLITLAQNFANVILLLVDAGNPADKYPPGFAKIFNCPVVGAITKYDEGLRLKCERQLEKMGIAPPWYYIDKKGVGLKDLKEYLLALNGG